VLLPQTWAAARTYHLQSSMNLAIGSALVGIGLTVPVVVPASIVFDLPLVLGLEPKDLAMPAMSFVVSAINA
jgi:Ca2+:H+ antiporter